MVSVNIGQEIEFDYAEPRTGPVRRRGRVEKIRDTKEKPITRITRQKRKNVKRSQFLLTVEHDNGIARSYYDANIKNCRVVS